MGSGPASRPPRPLDNPISALYLNHAGTSWPKPDVVLAAAEPTHPQHWPQQFDQALASVAKHFCIPTVSLRLTPGCTTALSVGLLDLPWRAGDRILTSSMEHEAVMRPLRELAQRGVQTTLIPRSAQGPFDLQAMVAALKKGRVRWVVVSMASNVTGELLPFTEIIALAHQHGASCFLDGAQTTGWMPLDLQDLGVDRFAFAGHKGPQAPTGIGGLYVKPGAAPLPTYCDVGSVSLPSLRGLAAGLRWMEQNAPLQQARSQERLFRSLLQGHVQLLENPDGVPTCAFVSEAPNRLALRLREAGILISVGHQCSPAAHRALGTFRMGVARVSFGPNSLSEEAEHAALAVIRALG